MIKIFELISFGVSIVAFGYGAFYLFRKGIPDFFKFYICAIGCYMLEELWVIVNSLLGNGSRDGLVTVRLVGYFGCLCFMLSAGSNTFDKTEGKIKNKKLNLLSLIAPLFLIAIYCIFAFSPLNTDSVIISVIGFLSLSPALFASYFNLKYLLLPKEEKTILKFTGVINILALVFYIANYIYPLLNVYFTNTIMSIYDLILALILFVLAIMCRKGACEWETRIS